MLYLSDIGLSRAVLKTIKDNFALIDPQIYKRAPNSGAGTGPPTSGAWVVDQLYIDENRAFWLCATGGTPGTWLQILPAVMSSFPSSPPDKYEVLRHDTDGRIHYVYQNATATWTTAGVQHYEHVQSTPSSSVTITHNLGRLPAVELFDLNTPAVRIWGRIEKVSDDAIKVLFGGAITFRAVLKV